MKNNHLLTALFVVLMSLWANPAEAQPEIWYPNHAYLHWEEPCADSLEYARGFMAPTGGPHRGSNCQINPFGTMGVKQTVYGVAFPLLRAGATRYNLFPDTRITLDIMLYHFTPGDSVVQLVKSQTFVVEPNQQPDLFLLHRLGHQPGEPQYPDSNIRKYPMYEFYFDEPQKMEDYFYVGMHSKDSFLCPCAVMFDLTMRQDCCHNGYTGRVDMNRNVLVGAWNYPGQICAGSELPQPTGTDGTAAPLPDTVFERVSQFAYPITKPKGYLSATTQVEEAGGVRLLPNPAKRWVTVEADCAIRDVELTDMAGRAVLSVQPDGVAKSVKLDIGRLTKGCYIVRVKTEQEATTQKLVIEN